jgi:hypothetical protein
MRFGFITFAGRPRARRGVALILFALLVFTSAALCAGTARAQGSAPAMTAGQERRRPRRVESPSPFEGREQGKAESLGREDGEGQSGESESGEDEEERRPRVTDPSAVMRAARSVHVRSLSAFVSAREVEDSLRKRKEVRAWGLAVTRNEAEADLVIEITRKSFSRRYTFTVLDPRTMLVVASGKTRSVVFGKKIANKIAEKFANRMRAARPYPPAPATP